MKSVDQLRFALAAAIFGVMVPGCDDPGDSTDPIPTDIEDGGDEIDVPDTTSSDECDAVTGNITISTNVTEDTTWCASANYILDDMIYVANDATLTIQAGTQVFGNNGSALVVTTSGMLDAQGRADAPIVFTSSQTNPQPGDWGGIVLLGLAELNVAGGTNNIEGIEPTELSASYGGNDDTHNCGSLSYARIEYAGFKFGADNELNSLTTGACGSDTDLHHIQVYKGLDDGIEMFGGTADLKYVVVTDTGDDGLDFDQGYSGRVQFALVATSNPTSGDPRGFEWDNDGDTPEAQPQTFSTVYNATVIQLPNDDGVYSDGFDGVTIRRGAGMRLVNAIVGNIDDEYFDLRDAETANMFDGETPEAYIEHTMFFGAGTDASDYVETCIEEPALAQAGASAVPTCTEQEGETVDEGFIISNGAGNLIGTDPQLDDNYVPRIAAASNGATPIDDGFFDTTANYYGAFDPHASQPWTADWTKR